MNRFTAPSPQGPARQWAVRFLSGPLRGRTLTLKSGNCLVGSAAECDILLPPTEALARHLVFTVGELALVMQRMDGAQLQLNGQATEASRRSLVAGDVVSVGKTDFQIDHVYEQADADEHGHADSMFMADDANPARAAGRRAGQRRPLAWPWLVAAAVVGAASVLAWEWGRGGPQANEELAQGQRRGVDFSRLEQVLHDYPEVEMTAVPGGRFGLKGHVETRARLESLRASVLKVHPHAVLQVNVAEDLVEQATRFVADPAVSIMYAGRGRLLATGSVDGTQTRERIKRLNSDWQPTAFIEDKLSVRTAQAQAKPSADADSVAFWQSQLPARLVSVTEGGEGLRHVQLANGHRYFEGSVLKSGAELKHVDAESLDIRPAKGAK